MRTIIAAIITLLSSGLLAQNFDNYTPLQCGGNIPDEFITPSSRKYRSEIKRLQKQDAGKQEQKDRERFALESSFVVDDMLQSGLVLFGDPISLYLNEVAAQITAANPNFKKKISVYAIRSKAINAFATDRGTIFVTLGLLARLENEAQLAYILSHELVHVQEGHAMDLYLEARDIGRNASKRSVLEEASFDEQLLSKNRYSRQLETEADNKGLEFFLNTHYSTEPIPKVFDVLQYAYLPFRELRFERNFFASNTYSLPEHYWLPEIKPISGKAEADTEEKSTHPDVNTRREEAQKRLEKAANPGDKLFLVSEERFKMVRQLSRFELPMLYLHNSQFAKAIYSAYVLLQEYPDNLYLQKCIAKALYVHAKYKNDESYELTPSWKETEGESQRVQFLTDEIRASDATALALHYAWPLHQHYPEDQELHTIVRDLFTELGYHTKSLDSDLTAEAGKKDTTTNAAEKKQTTEGPQRIEFKEPNDLSKPANMGWKGVFEGVRSDSAFAIAFREGQARFQKIKERQEYAKSKAGQAEAKKAESQRRRHGKKLGINKILVVNPYYLKLDARKDNAVQYIPSEIGQSNLKSIVETAAKATNLKVTLLDIASLKEGQADRFNDIRLLKDWFEEQVDYNDLSVTPGISQNQVSAVADKYGAEQVLFTGVISLREQKRGAGLAILAGLIYWPVLPFSIYWLSKPEYDMLFYAVLFNVKEGTYQTIKYEYFDGHDTEALLKAHYYDCFSQIKTKPGK